MKLIMYHYVQKLNKDFKFLPYLSFNNFKKQIFFFKKKYHLLDCNNLFSKNFYDKKSLFLTFDDGLSGHYKFVYKFLKNENINGIFYVPSLPYQKRKILDVHKIHLIIGKIGSKKAYEKLNQIIERNKKYFDTLSFEKYKNKIYLEEKSNSDVFNFKSYLNYFVKKNFRSILTDKIFKNIFGNNESKICKNFYLKEEEIKEMANNNMIIGSHSVSHPLLSELTIKNAKKEIDNSFKFIEKFSNKKTFCYPYGGFHSFNKNIEKYLELEKVSFSVNVEKKNVSKKVLLNRRQALPRYDCNLFPFGKISNNN